VLSLLKMPPTKLLKLCETVLPVRVSVPPVL
jgi:hypothetical protein